MTKDNPDLHPLMTNRYRQKFPLRKSGGRRDCRASGFPSVSIRGGVFWRQRDLGNEMFRKLRPLAMALRRRTRTFLGRITHMCPIAMSLTERGLASRNFAECSRLRRPVNGSWPRSRKNN
jgi:hypothetical protein